MKTSSWWVSQGYRPLIATHSGGNKVIAYVSGKRIIVDVTDLGSGETITVKTPFAFKVVDVFTRVTKGGNVGSKDITLKNNTSAISSTLSVGTDEMLSRSTTLDSTKVNFDAGDDDLVLGESTEIGDCDFMAVITIVPR